MTMRESFEVTDRVAAEIKPYVKAMMGASGLNEFDAVTSVLFAIATHIDLDQYPLLVYLGVAASGKSAAMKQLFPMCKEAKWVHGRTPAAHRNALKTGIRTAFIEEGDMINSAELIDLYTCRYSRQTATTQVNEPTLRGYELHTYPILGATVMHRRVTLPDVGLRSRSIIIRTAYRLGTYQQTPIGDVSAVANRISGRIRSNTSESGDLDRVAQTWAALVAISQELNMEDWRQECLNIQGQEAEVLLGGQGYEPSEAILRALDILSRDEVSHNRKDTSVRISAIVAVVRDEFALNLKHTQITEEAQAKGFIEGVKNGYPIIKVTKERLDTLLPSAG
jgi:hypothetical protein